MSLSAQNVPCYVVSHQSARETGSTTLKIRLSHIKELVADYADTTAWTHASSAAYYFFMSIIPIGIVVSCIVSQRGVSDQELAAMMSAAVPDVLRDFTEALIRDAYDSADIALTLSLLTLVWTTSRGTAALTSGLNAVYRVPEQRSVLRHTTVSLVAAIALFLLLTGVVYTIFSDHIIQLLAMVLPDIARPTGWRTFARSVELTVIGVAAVTACYTYLPAGDRKFASQLPGAVVVAVAWYLFSLGFHSYVDRVVLFSLYDSLATVVLFLFWLYWLFNILFFGAFVNRQLHEWHAAESPQG